VEHVPRQTVAPAGVTPEKLFCALVPVHSLPAGCVVKPLLVSVRLGGGAATGDLVTVTKRVSGRDGPLNAKGSGRPGGGSAYRGAPALAHSGPGWLWTLFPAAGASGG
jgi:hypothetical protein